MTTSDFSRRRFLRGLGTLMALPALEATAPFAAKAAGTAAKKGAPAAPLRMAFVYSPNGKNMDHWTPSKDGTSYELSRALAPLKELQSEFQVISGLKHEKARANGDGGGDHARANASFLTGVQARKTAGADIRNGISIDQVAANDLGQLTRLPSLELSCDEARRAGNCDSGYSCSYQFNLAWKSETTPLAPERDPKLAFERLFGGGGGSGSDEEAARAKREFYNKSVLDFVMEDAKSLQKHLGYTDKQKLDEYLTSVRDIERRLNNADKFSQAMPDYKKPTGIPQSYQEHIRLMFDLQVLAFQTDTTRISTFLLAHDGSNRSFPEIGVPDAHHGISHHQRDAEKLEKIAKIDEFYSEQFAYFLKRLRDVKEGNGSLLDNCMIVFGSGISDPDRHSHDDLPVILAGGGGGSLKKGRHLRLREDTPMCNLYLSLAERMGVKVPSFGDSTGKLDAVG